MDTRVTLTAPTRPWLVESVYPLRYVSRNDALDLGRLLVESPSLPRPASPTNLSGWIDTAFALLNDEHGTLLDGCSFVVEGRGGILAAVLIVAQTGQPQMIELAVSSLYQRQGIGTALVGAALDALHAAHYPLVAATVTAVSAHTRLLTACGFTSAGSDEDRAPSL
jgi:GNAT superfamily N-acetyltransferase